MFTSADCWVLFSIGFGNRGSRIKDIIASGDTLNHAILTKEELENGLGKLLKNGYIDIREERFFATEKAKNFYLENKKRAEGCIAEWIRMAEIFRSQPDEIKDSCVYKIAGEEYENAIRNYIHRFNSQYS